MITPNLDHLAATGLTFAKAYCQQAVCGPSRASFMTGRRPDHTMVFGNSASFRKTGVDATGAAGKDWVTMPEYVLCVLCVLYVGRSGNISHSVMAFTIDARY